MFQPSAVLPYNNGKRGGVVGRQDSQWLEGWSLEMGSEAGEAWRGGP